MPIATSDSIRMPASTKPTIATAPPGERQKLFLTRFSGKSGGSGGGVLAITSSDMQPS